MSIAAVLVYLVTILVAGIVALTYLKPHLLQPQTHPDQLPPKVHLYAGAAGLIVWILFLVSPPSFFLGGDVPGVIGLFGIWLAAIAGTYLLLRRLKEQRADASGRGDEDAYGYDDGYGDDYPAGDGYGYDEPGYDAAGYDGSGYDEAGYEQAGYDEYGERDERAYADPQQQVRQPVARPVAQPGAQPGAQPVAQPAPPVQPGARPGRQSDRRPEPRRATPGVEETAVMAPIEPEPAPAPPPAPAPAPPAAPARGSRSGQIGRRVAGRQAPEPPAPQPPAPAPPRQQRPAPERQRQEWPPPERPAPERSRQERPRQERLAPEPPAPERPTQPRPAPDAAGRSQDAPDPWGRRQEPPQRRPRGGYPSTGSGPRDGRYDDRRNDSHDEFADRRYRRDSSYQDYPGQPDHSGRPGQPQPAPPRAPRPAPQPAPRPAPRPAQQGAPPPAPAPAPPAPAPAPPAPPQQPGRRAEQQPDAYDPYSLESYGPRADRSRDQAQAPAQEQSRHRQPDQGFYGEQAYAGYEQGYDDAYAQGYGYDQAYEGGYDDRLDDVYERSAGGRRAAAPVRGGAFFEASGAAIMVHITLVILAIWLTWAYGTSVI